LYFTGDDYNLEKPGYFYNSTINPSTWEKNKPFNIGVDFGLFNRLSGTFGVLH
jgi:hypothetical protein